jgi:Tfp pilus assembly protein PilF
VNALRLIFLAALAAAVLAGCESAPIKQVRQDFSNLFQQKNGEEDLATGLRQYDEGNYSKAALSLQASLDAGLSSKSDQVKAHKYLAFIYCISERERQCLDEFRKALKIDPAFELSPAEAGHPTWGPVYRSAKGRR